MRWFWFATFTLICSLLSLFFKQPLLLIGEIFLIDIFLTQKIKWFFWLPKTLKRFPSWLNLLCWLTFTIWIIRLLAIDSITVVSVAGKPQLRPGDNVLISKIHFGPRLPGISPDKGNPFFRLSGIPGISSIKRGDFLAYNFPEGDSILEDLASISYYSWKRKNESENIALPNKEKIKYRSINRRSPEISRCIGLPGDTVQIPSSEGQSLLLTYDYLVELKNEQLPMDLLNTLGLGASEIQIIPGLGYLVPLRAEQPAMVRIRPEVTAMTAHLLEAERGDYNIFPHDARYPWNRDNFGPVIVPRKGDSIRLTLLNLCIYQRIIEVYESNRLEIHNDQIFINGLPAGSYTFKQDYFFVLGDNRHHSRDSRHWGFLPENHIIGKPLLIWLSASKGPDKPLRIYWNRILNRL
jgi:signal peptidase I